MEHCNPVEMPAAVVVKLVNEYGSKPANQTLYHTLISSLIYTAAATWADISYAVKALSKYNAAPAQIQMTASKIFVNNFWLWHHLPQVTVTPSGLL